MITAVDKLRATSVGDRLFWAAYAEARNRLAPGSYWKVESVTALREEAEDIVPVEDVNELVKRAENHALCDHYGSDG